MISPLEIEMLVRRLYPKSPLIARNNIAMRVYTKLPSSSLSLNELVHCYTIAYIRHIETPYDSIIQIVPKQEARIHVEAEVGEILTSWSTY